MKKTSFTFLLNILFFSLIFAEGSEGQNDTIAEVQYAKKLLSELDKNGNVSDIIDNTLPTLLPFGVKKDIAGKKYTIALDSITFTPNGAYLTAYTAVTNPDDETDTLMAFKAADVEFTPGGFTGDAGLELLADATIDVGEETSLTFKKQTTYVEWDCNGFKELGIDCDVTFSRNFIVPENPDGSIDTSNAKVTTSFFSQIQSWDELLIDVNLPPFQFTKLKGFGFYVSHAVFDFSETSNSPYMNLPNGYMTPSMPEPNSPMWEGFYLDQMQIKLPPEFKSKNSSERITFSADEVLIDELGITGELSAYHLLQLGNGSAGGWAFSLDTISVSLYTNQLENVAMAGDIQLPVMEEENALHYSGFIDSNGDYFLHVDLQDTLDVPLWAAKMQIYNNSAVTISKLEGEFVAAAVLNGMISITKSGDASVEIGNIEFQELTLQNQQPYFDFYAIGLNGGNQDKVSNFPITVHDIAFYKDDMDVGLGFNLAVNFVGEEDNGFSGDAGFTIWGELADHDGHMRWQYKELQFSEISIDIDASAFSLQGSLIIYQSHPVFGKGFKGMISAMFQPGFGVDVSAQFGNVDGFRYWYVDGLLTIPGGIPVFTGFAVYGFGGGAYYHMQRQEANIQIPSDPSGNQTDNSNIPGQSLSGVQYVPDINTHLGVRASIILGTYPSPNAFNATATFEMAFNSGGGLNYIGFQGEAYFMTPIADRGTDSKLYATTSIGYDFTNQVLHGETSVYLNMAPLIEGAGPNHLAGTSILHFAPGEWYITVGTPDQRVGVKIIEIFTLTSYFMIGTNIPAMPTPPSTVTDILGEIDFNRDLDALGEGSGFALGASLDIDFDGEFLIFYASFGAGAGFDIMLKNYGTDTRCSGETDPIGIKGWYAQGQVYAYIQGSLGIRIEDGMFEGDYQILDLGAAAVLQAKLPNPFWMQGNVGGYYSILGGLLSGQCNFEFELGEQCEIEAGTGLTGMSVIAETSPPANAGDVDVFSGAQAAFNMKVGQVFEFVDINNDTRTFKIVLDHFHLKHQGQTIPANLIWNDNHDVLAIETIDILPGETTIDLSVKVHFEEKINGIWQTVMIDGEPAGEMLESSFTTGVAPDYIPPHNVEYSYPIDRQMHFHKNEVNYGYIQLKQGQDYLFEANDEWSQKGKMLSSSNVLYFNYTYDTNANRVNFNLPSGMLNDKIYLFELVNIPLSDNPNIDENVEEVTETVISDEGEEMADITTKDIEGSLTFLNEKDIYSSYFKTSMYSTFVEKMDAVSFSNPWSWPILEFNGITQIGIRLYSNEYFDKFELEGQEDIDQLIRLINDNNNDWFNNNSFPVIYCPLPMYSCSNNYPSDVGINWREENPIGISPIKTSLISMNENYNYILTDEDVQNDYAIINASLVNINQDMDYYNFKDHFNLLQQAANHSLRESNSSLINILSQPYTSLPSYYPNYHDYNVYLKYVLPGEENPTSTKVITLQY